VRRRVARSVARIATAHEASPSTSISAARSLRVHSRSQARIAAEPSGTYVWAAGTKKQR
jgi:hypothetical protein